jgi:DNA-binding transcriptional regulator GbsR (MarR family)
MLTAQTEPAEDAELKATRLVAETLGDLMEFWNFKPSLGRVWGVLFLSQEALDAEEIERRAGLSSGNISQSLQELLEWGAIRKVPLASRRRLFEAETDIWALVARVFRERELRLIQRSVRQLEEAVRLLEGCKNSNPSMMLHNRFLVTRISQLVELAKTGDRLLDRLTRTGNVSFKGLKELLKR